MKSAETEKTLVLGVAGNPNSGKTTLFNRLTGLRQKVANYAGVTVERKEGECLDHGARVRMIDLPGTYALTPQSEEQRIAVQVVLGRHPDVPPLDGVLIVVDSTCLERSLYLVLQVKEAGIPMAVVLNMADELALRGAVIDSAQLSRLLDAPVIAVSATRGTGLEDLKGLISQWAQTPPRAPACRQAGPAGTVRPPMLPLPALEEVHNRRRRAKHLARAVFRKDLKPHPWTDRLDRWVMHPFWGPLIFAGVVLVVFQSIFTWAQPLMNLVDSGFTALGEMIRRAAPESLLGSFLADGVTAGVGSVVVFLPQILIVFFFTALLENSGYLARAALIMDQVMGKIGLQGKSFLPLISSYACAVPGIMATRTIENKHDRLATIFIAPFMTCSARLPVYALLISAFVPDRPLVRGLLGLRSATLLGLYVLGFGAALITARVLKSSILKSDRTPFFLEIPPYRIPVAKTVLLLLWDRSRIFLRRAGTVILGVSMVMWFLASFPRPEGRADLSTSFAGRLGSFIEPVIRPLGFDWKIGVGLISAQAAREVMVSTLATIYRVESNGEGTANKPGRAGLPTGQAGLQQALQQDMTPLSAVSLMVFFALAMQCTSTLAVVRRETGGWKIPACMFLYMNALAYLASLVVYQGGRLLGF